MNIHEALEALAELWDTATISQRVLMRRLFRDYGRIDLIPD